MLLSMVLLIGPHLDFGNISLELSKIDFLLEPLWEIICQSGLCMEGFGVLTSHQFQQECDGSTREE